MTIRIALAATVAALAATSAAPLAALAKSPVEPAVEATAAAGKPARQCFWTRQINNFASNDSRVLNIRVGVKDVYQFEMMGPCGDIDWNTEIAVRSRAGSQICTGLDAEVISPTSIGTQTCPVTKIRKLTEAEILALPKGARP